jgi:hypothetical protein
MNTTAVKEISRHSNEQGKERKRRKERWGNPNMK